MPTQAKVKSEVPYTLRMSKLLADPLRIKIVLELFVREMSPKQFHEEFGGGSLSRVCRHFDLLTKYDWLYQTRTETGGMRRGGVEHFYRATQPALFDERSWPDVPGPMKELFSWKVFETFGERVQEAMKAGTIDARDDRHMTWSPFSFDQQGWDTTIGKVDALFHFLFEEQKRASARLAESGEEPIPMTVALAAFESPKETEKQP